MDLSISPLTKILNPESVCIMGASNQLFRMGTWSLLNVVGSGYKGTIYIVHPKEDTIQGIKTYKDYNDLPEAPELVVLVVPTKLVPGILEKAGKKGTRKAVIITAGYTETGEEGRILQEKINEIVDRYDMNYIGPNCIGFVNSKKKINTTPFPYDGRTGGIGFASHSGSYVCHTLPLIEDFDIGISQMISLGNEGNIDVVDALNYFRINSEIRVVGLYLEGIRRPVEFREACLKLVKEKPVVALYSGNTPEGARSAASHTAAISTQGNLMDGLLKQCGVIKANTSTELYEWIDAFERQPLPKGPRVAILANSGGPATSMADHVGQSGLELPVFSVDLSKKIGELLPHTASGTNPIDLTFSPDPDVFSVKLPKLLAEAEEIDAILLYGIFGANLFARLLKRAKGNLPEGVENMMHQASEAQNDKTADIFRNSGKPVIGCSFDTRNDSSVKDLQQKGNIPFYNGPERAVKALEALWKYKIIREKLNS